MPLLNDLASYLEQETAMTVYEAVVVMSSSDGEIPRLRLFNDDAVVFGVFRGPGGVFMAEMTNVGSDPFFSEVEQGNVEVAEPTRLDTKDDLVIEPNWPSRKVQIDGTYYAIARNFAPHLQQLWREAQKKKR